MCQEKKIKMIMASFMSPGIIIFSNFQVKIQAETGIWLLVNWLIDWISINWREAVASSKAAAAVVVFCVHRLAKVSLLYLKPAKYAIFFVSWSNSCFIVDER